jgi:hypothetical protein
MDGDNAKSMKRLKFTYEDHIHKKVKVTVDFPIMRRFVDVISKDMVEKKVF